MNEITVAHIWMGGVIGIAAIYAIFYFVLDAKGKKNRELYAQMKLEQKDGNVE